MRTRQLWWVFGVLFSTTMACGPGQDPDALEDGDAEAPEQAAALEIRVGGKTLRQLGFVDGDSNDVGAPDYLAGRYPAEVHSADDAVKLLRGDFGRQVFSLAPETDFEIREDEITPVPGVQMREEDDSFTHYTLQQLHNGVPVDGEQVVVAADEQGQVRAVFAELSPNLRLSTEPTLEAVSAIKKALSTLGPEHEIFSAPQLVVWAPPQQPGRLAWRADVSYGDAKRVQMVALYADANTGALISQVPLEYSALDRIVRDGKQLCQEAALEGPPLIEEGGTTADPQAASVYRQLGQAYGMYLQLLHRDSFDGHGAQLDAAVHARFQRQDKNGNLVCDWSGNAMWFPLQRKMAYGDDLAEALDVTGHELTHAVIGTGKLRYFFESGALNESIADLFGAGVEAYAASGGSVDQLPKTWHVGANTWLIGENGQGGAFRDMAHPKEHGQPENYGEIRPLQCEPTDPRCCTDKNDHCDVHTNSGVPNKAFYLMSQGGEQSGSRVRALGLPRVLRFVYGSRLSWASTTRFRLMRHMTATAALGKKGDCNAWRQVQHAWNAVGVPGKRVRCPAQR